MTPLTRGQYLDILDDRFEIGRQRFIQRVMSLPKDAFIVQASAAWDRARSKYGPECDLHMRDLGIESAKECLDGVIYECVDDFLNPA